MNSFIR